MLEKERIADEKRQKREENRARKEQEKLEEKAKKEEERRKVLETQKAKKGRPRQRAHKVLNTRDGEPKGATPLEEHQGHGLVQVAKECNVAAEGESSPSMSLQDKTEDGELPWCNFTLRA